MGKPKSKPKEQDKDAIQRSNLGSFKDFPNEIFLQIFENSGYNFFQKGSMISKSVDYFLEKKRSKLDASFQGIAAGFAKDNSIELKESAKKSLVHVLYFLYKNSLPYKSEEGFVNIELYRKLSAIVNLCQQRNDDSLKLIMGCLYVCDIAGILNEKKVNYFFKALLCEEDTNPLSNSIKSFEDIRLIADFLKMFNKIGILDEQVWTNSIDAIINRTDIVRYGEDQLTKKVKKAKTVLANILSGLDLCILGQLECSDKEKLKRILSYEYADKIYLCALAGVVKKLNDKKLLSAENLKIVLGKDVNLENLNSVLQVLLDNELLNKDNLKTILIFEKFFDLGEDLYPLISKEGLKKETPTYFLKVLCYVLGSQHDQNFCFLNIK